MPSPSPTPPHCTLDPWGQHLQDKVFQKKKKEEKKNLKKGSPLFMTSGINFFYTLEMDSLSLPKEDRTSQDVSQPLFSLPSAVPLGGEGLFGGLPLICHHQKERTKPHAPGACAPARLHRTDRPQLPRGQDKNGISHLPIPPLPGPEKPCPARGRRTHRPWTPKCCMNHFKGKPVPPHGE